MFRCCLCNHDFDLDDVAVPFKSGRCICLSCFARETESARPMPKELRREISNLLSTLTAP
jgi:recombinational DNA repair protein (RecF pathway)